MTHPDDELDAAERDLAARLRRERPVPRPAFRGAVRRALVAQRTPPAWLWRRAGAASAGGLVCFALAGLGLTGIGPLG